jgi:hypothetical protein
MLKPENLVYSINDKKIVVMASIGLNDAVRAKFAAENVVQSGLRNIGDYFCVPMCAELEQFKDDCYCPNRATISLDRNELRLEVGCIYFKRAKKRKMVGNKRCYMAKNDLVVIVATSNQRTSKINRMSISQIKKREKEIPKPGFAEFGVSVENYLPIHLKKYSCIENNFASLWLKKSK